jgi:hypothetical protein
MSLNGWGSTGGGQFTSGGRYFTRHMTQKVILEMIILVTGGGGGNNNQNTTVVITNKPPLPIENSDDSGFLSNVRLKNQQKYFDLLNKYKPDDFDIRNQLKGTSNLTEEEANFMERYGLGKIYEDLSKQNMENFMDIHGGVAPKVDPTQITSPKEI